MNIRMKNQKLVLTLCLLLIVSMSLGPFAVATEEEDVIYFDPVELAAGHKHAMALYSDGTVWTWGSNEYGQLGIGQEDVESSSVPVQVIGLNDIIAISARRHHSLALKSDGTVWAWGNNVALGDRSYERAYTPRQVPELQNIVAVAAIDKHCLALQDDGTLWQWDALTPEAILEDVSNIFSGHNSFVTQKV